MADISKITLPSGNTYDIKDATARQAISGGVSFIVAWDGESAPTVADVPAGVKIKYNDTTYTGALAASNATPGAFYLIKSSTLPDSETLDIYDEYVPVETGGVKAWEKIGDTQLNLDDIVVDISTTDTTVIGSNATLSHTNPSVSISSGSSGDVTVATGITSVSASGDNVTAVTGVSATTKKLATTSVTGISGSSNQNIVASRTSQTTADGTGTASSTNTDWLKGISVTNEVLTIGAATLDTQTTYSADTPTSVSIPTAASTATTVATGKVADSDSNGDNVAISASASSTDTVLGTSSTITVTPTTTKLSASTSGGGVSWNSKDQKTVITSVTASKGTE